MLLQKDRKDRSAATKDQGDWSAAREDQSVAAKDQVDQSVVAKDQSTVVKDQKIEVLLQIIEGSKCC